MSVTDPVSLRIVSAVATASGSDPTDLPPLSETIDTDALDALFDAKNGSDNLELRFTYAGYFVRVEKPDVEVVDKR